MSDDNKPLYTIATASELLAVHPRTLRLYESAGLLRPARRNKRRIYSKNDLRWVRCVRYLIHEKGLNQEGLRRLMASKPCWETRGCSEEQRSQCQAAQDRTCPCWASSHDGIQPNGHCHECEVYHKARSYVCSTEETAAAEQFGPEMPI